MKKLLTVLLLMLFIGGCAAKNNQIDTPLSFDIAVKVITDNLLEQQIAYIGPLVYAQKINFVIDKIIDSDTGEVTSINNKISNIIIEEAKSNYYFFNVEEMNTNNLKSADFIIVGTISTEKSKFSDKKIPHLFLSVVDVKYNQIATTSDIWISEKTYEYEPTPLYKDSPMYIKDKRVNALIETAKAQAGAAVNKEYFDTLDTSALLDEAGNAYDNEDYSLALGLFAKAAERDDGKIMKTFSGLYQCFFKLHKLDDAEQAFATLVGLGMDNKNLSVKFLFKVDDTDFSGSRDDLVEYQIWLRQIAKKIKETGHCLQVVGHASRSGSYRYNKDLSLHRAQSIQNRLNSKTPGINRYMHALGKGFDENIIGTGTNDERDAIDRRVEFKMVNCNN